MAVESKFQKSVIDEIKNRLPGALVLKNDSSYCQGIPDLSIFFGKRWAMLECKKSKNAPRQPNQEYYVGKANEMAFASFIFPENKEEVINDLERFFKVI